MEESYLELEDLFNKNNYLLLKSRCEDLLQQNRNNEKILTYYSRSLLNLSEFKNAEQICLKILKINKNSIEAHLNLARIYSKLDQSQLAIDYYKKTILFENNSFTNFELGVFYYDISDYRNSGYYISIAIKLNPSLAEGFFYLGLIYQKASKFYLAIESLEEAIRIKPDYASAYNNLGTLFMDINKTDESIYYYNQAIKFNKKLFIAYSNLAQAYLIKGEFDKVRSVLNKCLGVSKNDGESHRLLTTITKYNSNDDQHFKRMLEIYKDENLDENSKMHLCFGLAKAAEDIKDYEKSAYFLNTGNEIRRKNFNYNITYDVDQFFLIKQNFNKDFFNKHKDAGNKTSKPIFIVGMPRSGTTLIEQIISSHPDVYGAGELEFLANIINEYFTDLNPKLFFDKLNECDSSIFTRIGEDYLSSVLKLNNDKKFITDKMPVNFRLIGFIKLAIPNAKIIHCCRLAQDTCLSIYKNYFGKNVMPWAYDQLELATYYNQYKDLMNFWNQVLPDVIYNVYYENLINDQENETKKLIEYCGLSWNDSCLNFHKNTRAVGTASVNQVRQKIYSSSLKLWENYKAPLSNLFDNLI